MSSKKRKTPADNAQPPVTAVSALAARRRLAESVAADADAEEPVAHSLTPSNAFSALRGLKRADSFGTSPQKSSAPVVGHGEQPVGAPHASPSLKARENTLSKIATPRLVAQYSSFVLSKRNSTSLPAGGLELRLQDGERFMIAGIFGLKLVTGHVTIQGASFRPGEDIHWVHASHIHAIPVIRTHQETRLQLLSDLGSVGLQRMGLLSPLYSQIWWRRSDEGSSLQQDRTFEMLFSSDEAPKRGAIQELVSPPAWNKKLASLAATMSKQSNLTVLICGPKSAGKSTTSRLLVNRLLTSSNAPMKSRPVALLDIDPGQPEYGPPGTLSLVRVNRPNLGTPITHPGIGDNTYAVLASHATAAVSPAANPGLYRECATALYAKYKSELRDCPLVINTPGWIQGTGLELLTELISYIKPHEVLYMSEDGPAESVDALREATTEEFTTLPSQPSELTARTAAELREMQTMSYFHVKQEGAASQTTRLRWIDQPLSAMEPIVIPYAGDASIQGIVSYDYQAPAELLLDSINGMVLALVGIDRPAAFRTLRRDAGTGRPLTGRTPEGIPFIANPDDVALDPRHSQLLGLVLVRGVDTKSRCLLGLSPALRQNLDSLNAYKGGVVLVHGNFGCPNWAYTEALHHAQSQDEGNRVQMEAAVASASGQVPWVEALEGNQSRPVGSRRWRVRRDLGRGG